VLRHFEVDVLTHGAGCQIYSTTFVQWASRECLHRAQPLILFARFATRQRSAPMEQLLARDPLQQLQDPEDSLTDADMGAYYTWITNPGLPVRTSRGFWSGSKATALCAPSPHIAARDDLYGVCEYAAGSGLDALAIAWAQKASKLRGEEASRSRSSSLHWQRSRATRLREVPF
jgi:hypothetical protein